MSSLYAGKIPGKEIGRKNPWYIEEHFVNMQHPSRRYVIEKRYRFIMNCIKRLKKRLQRTIKLLDAGCGDGYWLYRLSDMSDIELTGIDYNPLRVERAKKAVPKATIIEGDLTNITSIGKYDVVILNQVIEHIRDDVGVLCRMKSILDDKGILIIGTTNEGSILQQYMLKKTGAINTTDHVHFYTEKEILNKIKHAGFHIESIMREVFYPGDDRIYYWLNARKWGFMLLEFLTLMFPLQCSDYYFECRLKEI